MAYRTRTYIAGAWDEDFDAISQLYKWKESEYWSLDFVDAHELTQSRDQSNFCSIKKSLCMRMEHSKLFVLVVGPKTTKVRAGSCYYCDHYFNGRCYKGYSYSFDSFIEYECKKAVRDDMKIIVLYNSDEEMKEWCPEILWDKGLHIAMKDWAGRWDYYDAKKAFDYFLDME